MTYFVPVALQFSLVVYHEAWVTEQANRWWIEKGDICETSGSYVLAVY